MDQSVGYTVAVVRHRPTDDAWRYREDVGDLVRRARKEAEPPLSQERLGELLGVSRGTVTDYEAGRRAMSLDYLPVLVDRLRIEPEALAHPPAKARYPDPIGRYLRAAEHARDPESARLARVATDAAQEDPAQEPGETPASAPGASAQPRKPAAGTRRR